MKPPVGSFPPPTSALEAATQGFVETLQSNVARGSFIHAKMSVDYTGTLVIGDPVPFDTVLSSYGNLTIDGSGRISGLKANRLYIVLWCCNAADQRVGTRLWDVTKNEQIGVISYNTDLGPSSPTGCATFFPDQDSQIEVQIDNFNLNTNDIVEIASYFVVAEVGSTQVIGTGWIPVETKEVTGSAIENFEFDYPIDGNRDEAYLVEFFFKAANPGTTRNIRIRVNDLISSTNVSSMAHDGSTQYTDLVLSAHLRDYTQGYFIFHAAENPLGAAVAQPRSIQGHYVVADDPALSTTTFDISIAGLWSDAGNLTRMVLQNTVNASDTGVSEIAVGSIARLYRKARPSDYIPANDYSPGHIDGLAVSFNTVATVDIAPGSCRDSTNSVNIDVGGTLTANIGASGANGLDTGSEAASTWYALYVISGVSGTAALLSTSFTSPTLPSGYSYFRRVGSVLNDSGSDIEQFYAEVTEGRLRRYYWHDFDNVTGAPVLNAGTTSGTADFSSVAPPPSVRLHVWIEWTNDSVGDSMSLYRTGTSFVTHTNHFRADLAGLFRFTEWTPCDSSQQIDWSVSVGNSLDLWMLGWEETV